MNINLVMILQGSNIPIASAVPASAFRSQIFGNKGKAPAAALLQEVPKEFDWYTDLVDLFGTR